VEGRCRASGGGNGGGGYTFGRGELGLGFSGGRTGLFKGWGDERSGAAPWLAVGTLAQPAAAGVARRPCCPTRGQADGKEERGGG